MKEIISQTSPFSHGNIPVWIHHLLHKSLAHILFGTIITSFCCDATVHIALK